MSKSQNNDEYGYVVEPPEPTNAATSSQHHTVTWTIGVEASSPEAAASQVWQQIFGRDSAGHDDSCVFTVTDPAGGIHLVDLAEIDPEES